MLTKSKSTTLCWHVVLKVNQSRIGICQCLVIKKIATWIRI